MIKSDQKESLNIKERLRDNQLLYVPQYLVLFDNINFKPFVFGCLNEHINALHDDDQILQKIWELSHKTAERLARIQKSGKTVTVKIKTFKFETLSKQRSLRDPIRNETDIYNIAYSLYTELKDSETPIRLVGVTVGNLEKATYENMTIYDYI